MPITKDKMKKDIYKIEVNPAMYGRQAGWRPWRGHRENVCLVPLLVLHQDMFNCFVVQLLALLV
jgi:hypothetical protein